MSARALMCRRRRPPGGWCAAAKDKENEDQRRQRRRAGSGPPGQLPAQASQLDAQSERGVGVRAEALRLQEEASEFAQC